MTHKVRVRRWTCLGNHWWDASKSGCCPYCNRIASAELSQAHQWRSNVVVRLSAAVVYVLLLPMAAILYLCNQIIGTPNIEPLMGFLGGVVRDS